jgi:hypothetical protein
MRVETEAYIREYCYSPLLLCTIIQRSSHSANLTSLRSQLRASVLHNWFARGTTVRTSRQLTPHVKVYRSEDENKT